MNLKMERFWNHFGVILGSISGPKNQEKVLRKGVLKMITKRLKSVVGSGAHTTPFGRSRRNTSSHASKEAGFRDIALEAYTRLLVHWPEMRP